MEKQNESEEKLSPDEKVMQYWKERLNEIEKKVNEDNYVAMKRHIKRLEDESRAPNTITNHIRAIIPFLVYFKKKPIAKLTDIEVSDYFDSLKVSKMSLKFHKSTDKSFIKEINPSLASTIIPPKVKNKLKPADMLQLKDIEAMIDVAEHPRDKAIIAVYFDSGARKAEVLSCTIEDATFDNYGCRLWLNKSKTFERRVRLTYASSYLKQWLECHPTKKDLKSPIFCSIKPPYGLLTDTGVYHIIERVWHKTGLKRKPTPRRMRHSRATDLVKKLHGSEQKLKSVMGWTPNSRMAGTYVHLDDEDVDDMMLEAAGIKKEDEEPEKPMNYKCPRCKELNSVTQTECWKCGYDENEAAIIERLDNLEKAIIGNIKPVKVDTNILIENRQAERYKKNNSI